MRERKEKQKILHWADQIARQIIAAKGDKKSYTGASGITPSGTVHIGNFREIISTELVVRALRCLGKKVRFVYSWDDYDVFRKVPANMPKQDFLKTYLRKPIVDIPDPYCEEESFAKHNEVLVEKSLCIVGINCDFIYQHKKYRNGDYAKQIIHTLKHMEEIREILNKYRDTPLAETWLPVTVFSKKLGNDKIKNLRWNGKKTLQYELEDGTTEETDIAKDGNVKLLWRVDWPMRWAYEHIDFEPGGKDHSTVGGSYDTGKEIVRIFGWEAPLYYQYNFVSVKGASGKISSSAGNVITLQDCLEVYEPEIIRWLFAGTRPNAEFAISFDTDVIKIYEDFDKCERIYYGVHEMKNEKELANQKRIYELSMIDEKKPAKQMPFQPGFRHLTNIILQNEMDLNKTISYYETQLKNERDKGRLRARAICAKNWIDKYAPDDFRFSINKTVPEEVKKKLSNVQKTAMHELAKQLTKKEWESKDLHDECYIIIKNHKLDTKDFFTACYQVLINKDRGPKLAAFLIEIKDRAIHLLKSV